MVTTASRRFFVRPFLGQATASLHAGRSNKNLLAHPKSMHNMLPQLVERIDYPHDKHHRYMIVAHLFDDTMRMLTALSPRVTFDSIVGIPYSSNRPGVKERYSQEFGGDVVHIKTTLAETEALLLKQLDKSLTLCEEQGQKLIVQECGGLVVPLLHEFFPDRLHLIKGVVEITKQGVWRAQDLVGDKKLQFPVLHCADSELKRLEAKRCGETVARCLDGVARDLGLSLAGRRATIFGAGWIGSSVAMALQRLDMIVTVVDSDPLKVMEARLDGLTATDDYRGIIGESDLVVGATGQQSISKDVLSQLRDGTLVASASSRQMEIDMKFLKSSPASPASLLNVVDAYCLPCNDGSNDVSRNPEKESSVLVLNDGFPVNFIPGSGSVPDEIVETILGELILQMQELAVAKGDTLKPGIHRISPDQERICAELWLEQRDRSLASPTSNERGLAGGAHRVTPPSGQHTLPSPAAYSSVPGLEMRNFSTHAPTATQEDKKTSDNQVSEAVTDDDSHSPYLVQRLLGQKPNLYGVAKFSVVSDEIRKATAHLDRPVRILDLGCSTAISKEYLAANDLDFEYCGVDYEAAFEPDVVMDITKIHEKRAEIPWEPDVILLLDVLEHLPGKAQDIEKVMSECSKLVPEHGLILAVVPQLYRLDRLKLQHLHYPDHEVRFTLGEWNGIIKDTVNISEIRGIGYLSILPYLPMLSPFYREDNRHGDLFRYLRGTLFEWEPLKPMEKYLTESLGRIKFFQGWCNSSLFICKGKSTQERLRK